MAKAPDGTASVVLATAEGVPVGTGIALFIGTAARLSKNYRLTGEGADVEPVDAAKLLTMSKDGNALLSGYRIVAGNVRGKGVADRSGNTPPPKVAKDDGKGNSTSDSTNDSNSGVKGTRPDEGSGPGGPAITS